VLEPSIVAQFLHAVEFGSKDGTVEGSAGDGSMAVSDGVSSGFGSVVELGGLVPIAIEPIPSHVVVVDPSSPTVMLATAIIRSSLQMHP